MNRYAAFLLFFIVLSSCNSPSSQSSILAKNPVFNTEQEYTAWLRESIDRHGTSDPSIRYTFVPWHFVQSRLVATDLARIGLVKAINLVAVQADDIIIPSDVTGDGLLFALSLEQMLGDDSQTKWATIANATIAEGFSAADEYLIAEFDGDQPVPADRLAYNLTHGGIYSQLIEPKQKIGFFKAPALLAREKVGQATHRLLVEKAIAFSFRYIERRPVGDDGRSYWVTFDDFFGDRLLKPEFLASGTIPPYRDPAGTQWGGFDLAGGGGNRAIAAEAWMHMKNGLPVFYIWGNGNQFRNTAERLFVVDPLHFKDVPSARYVPEPKLMIGQCINCHVDGVRGKRTAVWRLLSELNVDQSTVSSFKGYFSSAEELENQYALDLARYRKAMRKIVEQVSRSDERFREQVIEGKDPREPVFFLTQRIVKTGTSGNTLGLKSRSSQVHSAEDMPAALSQVEDVYALAASLPSISLSNDLWPIIQSKCQGCHGGGIEHYVDLASTRQVAGRNIDLIAEAVVSGFMPPRRPLSTEDRAKFVAWTLDPHP